MARDPELFAHQQWLGYLQPIGLVVSAPALVQAGAFVQSLKPEVQTRFLDHLDDTYRIKDLAALLCDLFEWQPDDLVRDSGLEAVLTVYQETLRPTYAVKDGDTWLLLVEEVTGDLDAVAESTGHWHASPQSRFERLLRETGVPIGLLSNGTHLRLVYFPKGESPGHITFPCKVMAETAGRPVLAALLMLLKADRLFTLPDKQRLPALLSESRKYQNTVSTELAEQVLAALFELLRGFQAADDASKGELLKQVLAEDPDAVYAGLVTVLMRLVFLLYAEDRGLMSQGELYIKHYSVTGLFARLEDDAGHYPDSMDNPYGAWGQLVALWRIVYSGGGHGAFQLPARHGYLFKPEKYPFLEGRSRSDGKLDTALVSDGVVYRVLRNLLILDSERLSYRTLDVEQIGSVYEAIMGYRLEKAAGRSIALKSKKPHGAPITIDLEELLKVKERAKWLKEHADQMIDGKALTALKSADSLEALNVALEKRIARAVTPNIVPPGAMILQPNDERRKSGAHYTPRSLTGPIVTKALEPVLRRFGESPTPEQILNLKICDPAMGSAAFLVEVCRQLGDELVQAWTATNTMPPVPDDETPELLAMRTVATRCLYGVDRNPMAVDLAKLSLWLVTLAKDHPFTFLDHALRHGDSLVGLSEKQIRTGHWAPQAKTQMLLGGDKLRRQIEVARGLRQEIREAPEFTPQGPLEQKLKTAEEQLELVRFAGNLAVAAFFAADSEKKRNAKREEYMGLLGQYFTAWDQKLKPVKQEAVLRTGDKPIHPFHWEIEFPEVFGEGFDCIVGNPPFAGKNTIADGNRDGFLDWLKMTHEESHGNADLVAHFFRRAFNLLKPGGTLGLIATNTIAQGDTRSSGLRWICKHGGTIYQARRRYKWPGLAAVVVSVVHIQKSFSRDAEALRSGARDPDALRSEDSASRLNILDGKPVPIITAYLFHAGGHDDPAPLRANAGKSFQGSIVLGMGFTFDDTDKSGVANPISLMHELIAKDPRNAERIFPYIGGEEVSSDVQQQAHRFIINFGDMSEDEANAWPALLRIVRERVWPQRQEDKRDIYKRLWWQFAEKRGELQSLLAKNTKALVIPRVGNAFAFTFIEARQVINDKCIIVPGGCNCDYCVLQSRIHETWTRFFSTTLKDDLQYTPSLCFETFPFPEGFETNAVLEAVGQEYYDFRAQLMIANDEGLTKTYNRFHDPGEQSPEIATLRHLHAKMDRAVLDAYGGKLAALTVPPCEFLLDYEDDSEDDDEPKKGRGKKKPWRYRWPDTFRDEVLALLLELNKERAEAERMLPPPAKAKKPRKAKADSQPKLIE